MNGSSTRYASSSLLKKAQTWRFSPSWDPANRIGSVFLVTASPARFEILSLIIGQHLQRRTPRSNGASAPLPEVEDIIWRVRRNALKIQGTRRPYGHNWRLSFHGSFDAFDQV